MADQAPDHYFPWEGGRPRSITFLSLLFLVVSLFYLTKFIQVILQWDILGSLPLEISPVYLLVDGLFRAVAAGILTWSLWIGKAWSRVGALIISCILAAATWLELIFLADPATLQTRWPFNLVLTLLGLPVLWWILNREESKAFFRVKSSKTV